MADLLSPDLLHETVLHAPSEVALFAYGTLRPGQALDGLVDVRDHEAGSVYGHTLYMTPGGHYPFMVREAHGEARGDLLWVVPNMALLHTIHMEMRAGYDVEIVNVYTEGHMEPVPALAFVYPFRPYQAEAIAEWGEPCGRCA